MYVLGSLPKATSGNQLVVVIKNGQEQSPQRRKQTRTLRKYYWKNWGASVWNPEVFTQVERYLVFWEVIFGAIRLSWSENVRDDSVPSEKQRKDRKEQ